MIIVHNFRKVSTIFSNHPRDIETSEHVNVIMCVCVCVCLFVEQHKQFTTTPMKKAESKDLLDVLTQNRCRKRR